MVIGASRNCEKFGNKAVRAYLRAGHDVLPVNPNEDEVEHLRCYRSISEAPGPIDRALFYVPPGIGLTCVEALAARHDVAEVWLNPGAGSPELVSRSQALGFEPIQACAIIDIGQRP